MAKELNMSEQSDCKKIEIAILKYLKDNDLDLGDLKFYEADDWNERMGLKNSLGGAIIEGSVLFEILNMYDRMGNFEFSRKHHKGFNDALNDAGYWFEMYSHFEISFYSLDK